MSIHYIFLLKWIDRSLLNVTGHKRMIIFHYMMHIHYLSYISRYIQCQRHYTCRVYKKTQSNFDKNKLRKITQMKQSSTPSIWDHFLAGFT